MVKITVLKNSESGKSSFCRVTKNVGPFTSEVGVGYLYITKGQTQPEVGTSFDYDGGVDFIPLADHQTGEVRTTKEGVQLLQIVLK